MAAIAVGLGLAVGLTLGTFGGGGSIVVTVLVYGLSMPPVDATVLSKVIIGSSTAAAATLRWHAGSVSLGAAVTLAAIGAPVAYLGRIACRAASDTLVMVTLGVILLVSSLLMLLKRPPEAHVTTDAGHQPDTPDAEGNAPAWDLVLIGLTGVGVGFITGFLGVGGGFLIVPSLVLLLKMPMRRAIGTSLLVISINCAGGLAAGGLDSVQWDVGAPFVIGAIAGSVLATRLTHFANALWLQRGFAVLLLIIGVLILSQNARGALPAM